MGGHCVRFIFVGPRAKICNTDIPMVINTYTGVHMVIYTYTGVHMVIYTYTGIHMVMHTYTGRLTVITIGWRGVIS